MEMGVEIGQALVNPKCSMMSDTYLVWEMLIECHT